MDKIQFNIWFIVRWEMNPRIYFKLKLISEFKCLRCTDQILFHSCKHFRISELWTTMYHRNVPVNLTSFKVNKLGNISLMLNNCTSWSSSIKILNNCSASLLDAEYGAYLKIFGLYLSLLLFLCHIFQQLSSNYPSSLVYVTI